MKIGSETEHGDAVQEYHRLEETGGSARRRKELLLAIAEYENQFQGKEHNPGQPFVAGWPARRTTRRPPGT